MRRGDCIGCGGLTVQEDLIGAEDGNGETRFANTGINSEVFAQKRSVGGDAIGPGDGCMTFQR
jgi:hypothetical protein